MRIGILGGTFNPPHSGHIQLALSALEEANLSKIIFVPCGNPPHKDNSSGQIADAVHRLNMVTLATTKNSCFEVSDIEVNSSATSYTANLLESFQNIYPCSQLCFIMGADSLCNMESWYHPELIFKRAEILVALRDNYDTDIITSFIKKYEQKYNAHIRTLKMPKVFISSTEIRTRLKNSESVRDILCDSVFQYIKENKIYGV